MTDHPPATAPGASRIVATVFLPFAFGYFLSYLYRTVNAVIADDLAVSVGIGPSGLGLLTSAYFIAFAAFQLPLGILLDRFGPRRVEAFLLLAAAAGALVFAVAPSLAVLTAGRALIGLGVSACLMAALTANVLWWPKERLPMINGVFMAFGGMGAVFATTPVAALLTLTDWRGLFAGLAAITLAASVLIYAVVPERRTATASGPGLGLGALVAGTLQVFASPLFWRLAPASVLVQATFMAYLGLWLGQWLRDVDGFDRAAVAWHLQFATLAMVAGFAGLGSVAERLSRYGIPPARVAAGAMALCLLVQAVLVLRPVDAPLVLWVLYAFFAAASVMVYAILSQAFPAELAGRVNTATNVLAFVAAFVIQVGIGVLIERFALNGGGYDAAGHRVALLIMLVLQGAALLRQVWPRRAEPGRRTGRRAKG